MLAALGDGLAGVTVFGPNIGRPGAAGRADRRGSAAAAEPVIADRRGGRRRHPDRAPAAAAYPGNAALGAVDDTGLTEAVYRALGADLAALGINVDLAPSVDVTPPPTTRSSAPGRSAPTPALVARHAAAAVTGLQSAGVAACAKHFPGHGSTRTDSHDVDRHGRRRR